MHRHGDDARRQAAEEGFDEFEAGRVEEEGAFAAQSFGLQARRDGAHSPLELPEGQLVRAGRREEGEGGARRVLGGSAPQHVDDGQMAYLIASRWASLSGLRTIRIDDLWRGTSRRDIVYSASPLSSSRVFGMERRKDCLTKVLHESVRVVM